VNGAHLLHFLTRCRGAAARTPACVRWSPASGQRHKRGLAQLLSREFTEHSDTQDQSRPRLRTARRPPQHAEVAPHERQLYHRQKTTGQLLKARGDPPPGAPVPPILPSQDGFLFLDREMFHASFAGDLSAEEAAFMADSQVPWGVGALSGTVSEPAWRSKPSWYLVETEDRMIPPPAQRSMSERAGATVEEAAGSHAIYVSQPSAVAALIEKAASEVSLAAR
jgi:hypothetical protein